MQQTIESTELFPPVDGADALQLPDPRVAHLCSAFLELEEEHRIVLSLHYFERLSLEEIALVLDDDAAGVREVYLEALARLDGERVRRRDAA